MPELVVCDTCNGSGKLHRKLCARCAGSGKLGVIRVGMRAAELLEAGGATFRERNAIYGDNYKKVGEVMAVLFPESVQLRTEHDYNKWHLFELMIVKLTRFTNSGLSHADSVHDLMVYAAMVESMVQDDPQHKITGKGSA